MTLGADGRQVLLPKVMRGRIPAWPFSMSFADLTTLYNTYIAAVDAASWSTAASTLAKIAARIGTTAVEVTRDTGQGGSQSFKLDAKWIGEQQQFCLRMHSAATAAALSAGPIQQIKVQYQRADSTDDYS